MISEQPMVMRVFLALCSRIWAEQEALLPLPSWQTLPQVDRESISLAALLTVQEMMSLQQAGELQTIVARQMLPALWDRHWARPPQGGMPRWQDLTADQKFALCLIAQCLAVECACSAMDPGEA
jgi:hypothetical protein